MHNICCCSVAQSCPTVCDPMDCSMPGFPVFHCLPEFAQTYVHLVGDSVIFRRWNLKEEVTYRWVEGDESPISLFLVSKVIIISFFIHGLNMSYCLKKISGKQRDMSGKFQMFSFHQEKSPLPHPSRIWPFHVFIWTRVIPYIWTRLQVLEFLRCFWWKDRLTKNNFHRIERFLRVEVLSPAWTAAKTEPQVPGSHPGDSGAQPG